MKLRFIVLSSLTLYLNASKNLVLDLEKVETLEDIIDLNSPKEFDQRLSKYNLLKVIKNIKFGKETALTLAAKNFKYKIVKYLLEVNINPNQKNDDSKTALHILAQIQPEPENYLAYTKTIEILLNNGAKLDEKHAAGETPLSIAYELGQLAMKIFLDHLDLKYSHVKDLAKQITIISKISFENSIIIAQFILGLNKTEHAFLNIAHKKLMDQKKQQRQLYRALFMD